MLDADFKISLANWPTDREQIFHIRETVFVKEQNVPLTIERDGKDIGAWHALAYVNDKAVGTGRLLPNQHIGRLAVMPEWRHQHIGSHILAFLTNLASSIGMNELILHAQENAIDFYRQHGFNITSPPFAEANIMHVEMRKQIDPQ